LDASHDDRERFEEGSFDVGEAVWEFVQPLCGMDFVSLQCPRVWIDSGKLYVFAEVIPAVVAEEAFFAGNAGLDGYPVAWLELGDAFTAFQDYASRFMADNAIALEY
jgi:hypothetical protein